MSDSVPINTLILVPTQLERERLESQIGSREGVVWANCGFGPVAAAAATQLWLQRLRPRKAVLVGIAGSLPTAESSPPARSFGSVSIEGLGAWQDQQLLAPGDIGFSQIDQRVDDRHVMIGDQIPLIPARSEDEDAVLLTVCAASGSTEQAAGRARRHTDAVAEDMEGFGVATACRLCDCPLTIIRGMSNVAGNRDKRDWRIDDALAAAAELLETWLASATS